MFSQACVKNSVHGEGDVCGKGEACMAKGVGMCGEGRHAWQRGGGVCGKGGMHGNRDMCGERGHAWQRGVFAAKGRACMARGACRQRGGACVVGETATAADGMHPTGMHSCTDCFRRPGPIYRKWGSSEGIS